LPPLENSSWIIIKISLHWTTANLSKYSLIIDLNHIHLLPIEMRQCSYSYVLVYGVYVYMVIFRFSPASCEVNSKMWRWNMMINSRMRRGGGLSILIWSTFISNICSALCMIKMSKQHEENVREREENEFDYWWRCFTIFSSPSFHSLIKL
jgi:hypothetical protein